MERKDRIDAFGAMVLVTFSFLMGINQVMVYDELRRLEIHWADGQLRVPKAPEPTKSSRPTRKRRA